MRYKKYNSKEQFIQKYLKYAIILFILFFSYAQSVKFASAKSYISDIKICKGKDAAEKLTDSGYTVMLKSINYKDNGDTWLYLGYKITSANTSALRDIIVSLKKSSSITYNGISYKRVPGDGVIESKIGKVYMYTTKDKKAGDAISSLDTSEWNKGDKKTKDLALLNDGSTPVKTDGNISADLDKDKERNIYLMVYRDNMYKRYLKEIALFKGDSLREAVIKASDAGFNYYSKDNLNDGNGYTLLAYKKTNEKKEAITDVVCVKKEKNTYKKKIKVDKINYNFIKNGELKDYLIYATTSKKYDELFDIKTKNSYEGTSYTLKSMAELFFGSLSDSAKNHYIDDEGYNKIAKQKTKIADVALVVTNNSKKTPFILVGTKSYVSKKKKIQNKYEKTADIEESDNNETKDDNKDSEVKVDNSKVLDENAQEVNETGDLPDIMENEEGAVTEKKVTEDYNTADNEEDKKEGSLGSAFTKRNNIFIAILFLLITLLILMIINMIKNKTNKTNKGLKSLVLLLILGGTLSFSQYKVSSALVTNLPDTFIDDIYGAENYWNYNYWNYINDFHTDSDSETDESEEDSTLEPLSISETTVDIVKKLHDDNYWIPNIKSNGSVTAPLHDGEYEILVSDAMELGLDVDHDNASNGTNCKLGPIQEYACSKFRIEADEYGWYTITSCCNNLVLDEQTSDINSNNNLYYYGKHSADFNPGKDNQKWMIALKDETHMVIINQWNGRVIDVAGSSFKDDTNVQCYSYNGTGAQFFYFKKLRDSNLNSSERVLEDGIYKIKNESIWFKKYYSLSIDDSSDAIHQDYADFVLAEDKDESESQKFYIRYIRDGYYTITNMHSGKLLIRNYSRAFQKGYPTKELFYDDALWKLTKDDKGNINISTPDLYYLTPTLKQLSKSYGDVYTLTATKEPNHDFVNWSFEKCKLSGSFYIVSAWSEKLVLNVASNMDNKNNVNVNVENCLSQDKSFDDASLLKQKFMITERDGYYNIDSMAGPYTLVNKGDNLELTTDLKISDDKKIILKQLSDNRYHIGTKKDGFIADLTGRTATSGTNVQMYSNDSTLCSWRNFTLIPAGTNSKEQDYASWAYGHAIVRNYYDWCKAADELGNVSCPLKEGIYQFKHYDSWPLHVNSNNAFGSLKSNDISYAAYSSTKENSANGEGAEDNENSKDYRSVTLFMIKPQKSGYVKIYSLHNGKYLSTSDDKTGNDKDGNDLWQVVKTPQNKYIFFNKNNPGKALNVSKNSPFMYTGYEFSDLKSETLDLVYLSEQNADKENAPLKNGVYRFESTDNQGYSLSEGSEIDDTKNHYEVKTDDDDMGQRYYIRYIRDGFYSVCNMKSGRYLTSGGSILSEKNYDDYDPYLVNSENMLWKIKLRDSGSYQIEYSDWSVYEQTVGIVLGEKKDDHYEMALEKMKTKDAEKNLANFKPVECDLEGAFYICSDYDPEVVLSVNNSYEEGRKAMLSPRSNSTFQKLYLHKYNDEYYTVENCETGFYLNYDYDLSNDSIINDNPYLYSYIMKSTYKTYDYSKNFRYSIKADSFGTFPMIPQKEIHNNEFYKPKKPAFILIPAGESIDSEDVRISKEKYSKGEKTAKVTWYVNSKSKKSIELSGVPMSQVWEYAIYTVQKVNSVKKVEIKMYDDWISTEDTKLKINGTKYTAKKGDMGVNLRTRDIPIVKEKSTSAVTIEGFKNGGLYVPKNKSITIDLNGHKIERVLSSDEKEWEDGNSVIQLEGKLDVIDTKALSDSDSDSTSAIIGGKNKANGGAIYMKENSELYMQGITLSDNGAMNGGAIYCENKSSLTLTDVVIKGNRAVKDGAGIYSYEADVELHNVIFDSNRAGEIGGAIYADAPSKHIYIDGGKTDGNLAGNTGKGIYLSNNSNIDFLSNVDVDLYLATGVMRGAADGRLVVGRIYNHGLNQGSNVRITIQDDGEQLSKEEPIITALTEQQIGYFKFLNINTVKKKGDNSYGIYMGAAFTPDNQLILMIVLLGLLIAVPVCYVLIRRFLFKSE